MTLMTTKAQRRARAAAKEIFDRELHARIDRERNTPSDAQKRQALMRSCVAEAAAESAAARERELAPVREVEQTLNADRERAARNARYNLSLPNCAYLAEICPPFSGYTGKEEDYLDSVRNIFINDFQPYLERTGVALTQSGLESLAALSDRNTSLNWADLRTFQFVFEHLCEVGYAREGRDYTVTEQAKTEPAPVESASESFDTLLRTRSIDDPVLKNAARDAATIECQPVFTEWVASLADNFGYVLPLSVAKYVERWFIQNNRSFLDRTAYDACRRACVREGLMPRTCLTADDLAGEEMDGLDLTTVEGRRRAAQLHREGLRRAEQALSQNQSQSPSQEDF
jgi:hypothetical protein